MISTTVFIVVIIAVCVLEWLILKLLSSHKSEDLKSELKVSQARNSELKENQKQLSEELTTSRQSMINLEIKNSELATRLAEQEKNLKEQMDNLLKAKEQMKQEFENVATGILKVHSKEFNEQSEKQINTLLTPFKTDLEEFRKQVKETYNSETSDRISLREQIKLMDGAYKLLSKDAENLVQALKADTKTQGDWGEINLKRILDFTGLKEGIHYFTQAYYKNEAGENLRPDIVVNLPDNRQIIVDSKVSLTGYERYFSAAEESDKDNGIKDHLKSIRKHVIELSEKKYEDLKGINTLDFVLMFIPVEAAYFVAINNDLELYKFASEKKVLLVCPSTLLITMQLVGSLWRIDDQKRHVYEIAEQGARLYDKFVGFVNNLTDIKKHLDKSQEAYQKAHSQLVDGKGNLITQASKLVKLGVKSKSRIPEQLLFEADEIEETTELDSEEAEIIKTEPD